MGTENKQFAPMVTNARRMGTEDRILDLLQKIPRDVFVPPTLRSMSYQDSPLPIGEGQTISQPSLVAFMTSQLNLNSDSRVLEIGTGCGYQTAFLCELAQAVFSIEVRPELSLGAQKRLMDLGYTNVHFKIGDGTLGWPENAPYDGIIVTAAARAMPPLLIDQLSIGGRMIIPLEVDDRQVLKSVLKTPAGLEETDLFDVRFVPIVTC